MSCSYTGGNCLLALPTPCGACASEEDALVHPETGELFTTDQTLQMIKDFHAAE